MLQQTTDAFNAVPLTPNAPLTTYPNVLAPRAHSQRPREERQRRRRRRRPKPRPSRTLTLSMQPQALHTLEARLPALATLLAARQWQDLLRTYSRMHLVARLHMTAGTAHSQRRTLHPEVAVARRHDLPPGVAAPTLTPTSKTRCSP